MWDCFWMLSLLRLILVCQAIMSSLLIHLAWKHNRKQLQLVRTAFAVADVSSSGHKVQKWAHSPLENLLGQATQKWDLCFFWSVFHAMFQFYKRNDFKEEEWLDGLVNFPTSNCEQCTAASLTFSVETVQGLSPTQLLYKISIDWSYGVGVHCAWKFWI